MESSLSTSMTSDISGQNASSVFSREHRLLKGKQFNHVFASARRSSDRYFTVLMRENDQGKARLGLAIAKKRIPLAVGRNRAKRLIRESFRHHCEALGTVDVVVLSRININAPGKRIDNATLQRSLSKHWQRLSTA